jgi:putative (di)nucleoside polyphosphate hydrolase
MENNQVYRASVAAIIVNKNKEFLLVQLNDVDIHEWDFVKGGMQLGESEKETLVRELKEELGNDLKYKILEKSNWCIVYDWPDRLQKEKGFKGQARVNYWIFYKSGKITIEKNELREYLWASETNLREKLSRLFSDFNCNILENEWLHIKNKNADLFTK